MPRKFRIILRSVLSYCRKNPALIILLIFAAGYFLLYYFTDQTRPADVFSGIFGYHDTAQYKLGWWGWHDQGSYLKISKALADFNFSTLRNVYSYGLGYPLVAVPALWLGFNNDPFVFFNLFAFLFAAFSVYKVAQHFISPTAGFLAGFGLVFATPLLTYTSTPWNSTVCLVAMSAILLMATATKPKPWQVLLIGLCVGWAFAARYVDVVWLFPMAAASMYRGSIKQLIKPAVFFCIGLVIWLVPVLYSHYWAFGSPLKTPYVNHLGIGGEGGSDQQLTAYSLNNIPEAAAGMFIGPRLANQHDSDKGWLVSMFWVLAAIPGAFIVLRNKKNRWFFGTLLSVTIVASLFYLSFRASTPYSLKYGVLHYFKMFWLGLVVLAVAFFDKYLRLTYSSSQNKASKD